MGYRDERLALNERLQKVEPKHAELSGTLQGLRHRHALAEDHIRELDKAFITKGVKNNVKRRIGLTLGILLVAVAAVGVGYLMHHSQLMRGSYQVLKVTGASQASPAGASVEFEQGFSQCLATVTLADSRSFTFTGVCDQTPDVYFWGTSPDGSFAMRIGRGDTSTSRGFLRLDSGPMTFREFSKNR